MDKRGQAAMEFLMTYGWAILAAIVAIGVLAFFLANPGRFTSNSCAVAAPFTCEEFAVNDTSVIVRLRNGAADNYNVGLVTAVSNALGKTCTTTTVLSLTAGNATTFYLSGASCNGLSGTTFRGDITITYIRVGGVLNQTGTGTLTYRVP